MNDLRILDNLFNKHNDEIHFDLSKELIIIQHNNNNKGDFNREISFNTQSLASQIINYKDAYISLEIQVDIPYDSNDSGKNLFLKKYI